MVIQMALCKVSGRVKCGSRLGPLGLEGELGFGSESVLGMV